MLQTEPSAVVDAMRLLSGKFNDYDQDYFRLNGAPVTEYQYAQVAARLYKYAKLLPTDIGQEIISLALEHKASISNGDHAPLIIRGDAKYFLVRHVDRSNKDLVKAAAERAVGKRCLLWNIPEFPNSWAVAAKFVGALVNSGEFDLADGISEADYRAFKPASAPQAPPIDWSQLAPQRTPRPFQKEGVEFLVPALVEPGKGALLADDQGLGKTIQALMVTMVYGERLAVVCPAGVRYNWVNEIFLTHPTWTVCVLFDKARSRTLKSTFGANASRIVARPDQADVIVMGYETTRQITCGNPDPHTACYHTMKYMVMPSWADTFKDRLLVCDEMHYGKNTKAKRTQAVLAVSRACRRVLAMTGTPICNRPAELWPILCAIGRNREVAGSAADFKQSYVEQGNLEELHRRLASGGWFIRRLKKDVLTELPPKQRQDLIVEMSPRQALEYEQLRQGLKTQVKNGGMAKNGTCILALLTALQTKANEAKVEPIVEMLQERADEGYFTVVSCERTEPLFKIRDELAAAGVSVQLLYGGSTNSEKKQICTDFADGKIQVVLTTLAEGINLQKADCNILLDLPWSPGKVAQKEDRIHRIGQTAKVLIVRVLAASIDHHKKSVIADKADMIDIAINGGDSPHADDECLAEVVRRLVDED